MIGEELSAESELGQQSVSLCDDSGNNSVFFHEAQGNLLQDIGIKTLEDLKKVALFVYLISNTLFMYKVPT